MLVVITGGPFSGKTTLVEALGERGHRTGPEAAIEVISELERERGPEGQREFRRSQRAAFQEMVLARQIEIEERAIAASRAGELVFLDRSRLDGIAYCRYFETPVPPSLAAAARLLDIDRVFLLDTLSHAHVRTDTGRTSDRATSLAIRDHLDAVYREYGHHPIRVPEASVKERVEQVLAAVRHS